MILALDTANNNCAVCLFDETTQRVLKKQVEHIGRGHAERLLPLIQEVLLEISPSSGDLAWHKIDKIAVAVGPGSFTGLRVGLSVARAIGLSQKIPQIGITHFAAIAHKTYQSQPNIDALCVVQDARRGEVFYQYFTRGDCDCLPPKAFPKALPIAEFVKEINQASCPMTLIGSGVSLLQEHNLSAPLDLIEHDGEIDIEILAQNAAQAPAQQDLPKPLYIRAADAKPQSPLMHLAPKAALS